MSARDNKNVGAVRALAPTRTPVGRGRRLISRRVRGAVVYLSYGAAAMAVAAGASLLADGTAAKRVVWVVTAVGFSVAAGIVHALAQPLTRRQPEPDRPPALVVVMPADRPETRSRYPAQHRSLPSPR